MTQRNLKITFEFTITQANRVAMANGTFRDDTLITHTTDIIENSRHTVLVKASEQSVKLATMQDNGYRVVKILTCNF